MRLCVWAALVTWIFVCKTSSSIESFPPTAAGRDSSIIQDPFQGTQTNSACLTMAPVKYASLVSADGLEFTLPREACLVSPMLKASLESGFSETETGRISLPMLR